MRRHSYPAAFVLACALSACASSPDSVQSPAPQRFNPATDPYWADPRWQAALLQSVQAVVHNPVDAADMSTPGLHGEVQFTLADGSIEYPDLAASTGDPNVDRLMLQQVVSAQPPKPTGPYAGQAHDFTLELDMPTPFESFQYSVYASIDYQKVYPKDPILAGATGNTTVDFDYLDGRANNISMTISSKNKELDKSSIGAVTKAVLPPAPQAYAGKSMHMEVIVCYTLMESSTDIKNKCPTEKNVIVVLGTRIVRATISVGMGGYR